MKLRTAVVAVAAVLSLIVSACSAPAIDQTTTESPSTGVPELEFGTGVLPATVPDNFPMPEPSAISTTMVDGSRDLTEVVFNVGGDVDSVTVFYTVNLPTVGYEITDVTDGNGTTAIAFAGHGIEGVVTLKVAGQNVTAGTLVFVFA